MPHLCGIHINLAEETIDFGLVKEDSTSIKNRSITGFLKRFKL